MKQSLTITFDKAVQLFNLDELRDGIMGLAFDMGLGTPEIRRENNQFHVTVETNGQDFDEFCQLFWYVDDVVNIQKKVGRTMQDVPQPRG